MLENFRLKYKKRKNVDISTLLRLYLEAPPGFEPGIRVLQTRALPLGYSALYNWSGKRGSNPRPLPWQGSALSTELFPQKYAFLLKSIFIIAKFQQKVNICIQISFIYFIKLNLVYFVPFALNSPLLIFFLHLYRIKYLLSL